MTCRATAGPISGDGRKAANSDPAEEIMQLRAALSSRDIIGQAKGVLIALHGCTAEEAFAILRDRSQQTNVKLRLVAGCVVAERTGLRPLGRADRADIHRSGRLQ